MILYNVQRTLKKIYSRIEKFNIRNKISSAKMIIVHSVHKIAYKTFFSLYTVYVVGEIISIFVHCKRKLQSASSNRSELEGQVK